MCYFLILQFKHVFWVLKTTVSLSSFQYPHYIVGWELKIKKIIIRPVKWTLFALNCDHFSKPISLKTFLFLLMLYNPVALACTAHSVTCLVTDACLTADPGFMSSIRARSHTLVEIDHEIISTVKLLPSAESFKKDCCQLQAKVCARSTG